MNPDRLSKGVRIGALALLVPPWPPAAPQPWFVLVVAAPVAV